jgi:hypothetical protein|tara:strand:+ start:2321 stop:2623 length:303 start_codon:yes stop_codon:yes gene_type:complete
MENAHNKLNKTEAVERLISLAKELDINENFDWTLLNVTEESTYEMVANNVLTQMYETPETYRDTVMMASMVKMLVENIVLKTKIQAYEKQAKFLEDATSA